mgnify:CR=1 FL=1
MRRIFVIIFFFLFWNAGHATNSWNYRQCARYALEHSLALKDMKYQLEKQEYRYKSALNDLLPSVDGGTTYGINNGKTVDPNTNDVIENEFFSNSYRLSGSIGLFNGFRKYNRIRFEKYNLKATDKQYEQQKNNLVFRVLDAFTQYLLNVGLVDIQQQQLEMSEKELERVNELIDLGRAPASEKYEVEARLASDEFVLTRYQKLTDQSLLQLKILMNYPADSTLHLQSLLYDSL